MLRGYTRDRFCVHFLRPRVFLARVGLVAVGVFPARAGMNRPRARVRSDSGCLTSAARRSLTVGRRQQSRNDGGDIDRVSTRLSHPEPTATDLFGDFSQSVVMLPSNRASSLGMIMTTFVAIDFETANHRRDSACAVGLATGDWPSAIRHSRSVRGSTTSHHAIGTGGRQVRDWCWAYFSQPIVEGDRSLCSPVPSPPVPRQRAQSAHSLGTWRARQDSNLRPSA